MSLESLLKKVALCLMLILAALSFWIMQLLNVSSLVMITSFTLTLLPLSIGLVWLYRQIINPFYRLTSLVEAIRLEDYSMRARKQCSLGIAHKLFQEISTLAEELQHRKLRYDQHSLLIFHLIEQLDTPIAVFNDKHQLSHANAAFSKHVNQPWQSLRHYPSSQMGLEVNQQQWVFSDQYMNQQWQLRQSRFIQQEHAFHLVILTNIEQVLREQQQASWRQIIRVLSHEIRNSLTPIKSLAQSLAELPSQDVRSQQALNVIVNRSDSLQDFVNRYANMSKKLTVKPEWVKPEQLISPLYALFPDKKITVENNISTLWVDAVLLQQVLINLLKNAFEASAKISAQGIEKKAEITLTLSQRQVTRQIESGRHFIICVIDQGQGIANKDNLFVPFYTTKENGHGIGLGLCQNIIEQHGGRLTLENNSCGVGACAEISIPYPTLDI